MGTLQDPLVRHVMQEVRGDILKAHSVAHVRQEASGGLRVGGAQLVV